MRGPASCSLYLEDQLALVGSVLGCSDSADGDEVSSFNLIATVTDLLPSEFLGEAVFAAGNFWELEATFCRVDGFVKTATGYYGGTLVKPCYKEVLEGNTDHIEAVKLTYDKRKTSYKSLCKLFWASHDPTSKDYLGYYRSVIFYGNEEEKKQVQALKIERQIKLNRGIVTKIIPCPSPIATGFFMAESQHQKYHLQKDHIRLCECLKLRSANHFADSHIDCKLNGLLYADDKSTVEGLKKVYGRIVVAK